MKLLRVLAAASLLAAATLGTTAGSVAAYGRADQPLAQIEFSANCNNPAFPLCAPPPSGFGLGGIWLWIEVDGNNTGDVAGAGCGHVRGGGGGAGSIRGDITWWASSPAPQGESFFVDPNGRYYNVNLGGGQVLSFPQTVGHYAFSPVHGVTIQLTVAP